MSSHRLTWLWVLGLLAGCRLDLAREDEASSGTDARDDAGDARTSNGNARAGSGAVASASTATGRGSPSGDESPQPVSTEGVDCARPQTLVGGRPWPKAGADGLHLSGLIAVAGHINVTGSVVIDPGTTFVMQADSAIEFAWNSNRTSLSAQGTPNAPIRFCRDELGLGHWESIIIGAAATSDSVLTNVELHGGGAKGAAMVIGAPITVTNLSIYDSKLDGVLASTWGDGSSGLIIDGAGRDAAVATAPTGVDKFPSAAKLTNNQNNLVRLTYNGIGAPITFRSLGVPYVQMRPTLVRDAAILTFEAGVDYRFAADTGLEVGWNANKATIVAKGTETAPVVFQGLTEEPGSWAGLAIQSQVSTDSTLEHVRVLYGGGVKTPPLALRQSITLVDVQVLNAASPALLAQPPQPDSSALVIRGCTSYPLDASLVSLPRLPPGSSFTGNAEDQIHVGGANTAVIGTIPGAGVPYLVGGNIALAAPSDITIGPGAELVFQSGYRYVFEAGWNGNRVKLKVAGTAAEPVIFRGQSAEPGSWEGFVVRAGVSTDSSIDYLQVRNAPLKLDLPIAVTNSSFSDSATYGIVKSKNDTTDYHPTNTFARNVQGDISP